MLWSVASATSVHQHHPIPTPRLPLKQLCCCLQTRSTKWWIDESNDYITNEREEWRNRPVEMTLEALRRDFAAAGRVFAGRAASAANGTEPPPAKTVPMAEATAQVKP